MVCKVNECKCRSLGKSIHDGRFIEMSKSCKSEEDEQVVMADDLLTSCAERLRVCSGAKNSPVRS